MVPDETTCPDCAETIKIAARVCKHCGFRLQPTSEHSLVEKASAPPTKGGLPSLAAAWEHSPPVRFKGLGLPMAFTGLIGALLFVGFAVNGFDLSSEQEGQGVPPPRLIPPRSESEKAGVAMGEAKATLNAALRDGDSATYRNLFVSRDNGGRLALCGEVNSRNGFGGLTGYKRFIAWQSYSAPIIEGETRTGAGDDADRTIVSAAFERYCSHVVERFD